MNNERITHHLVTQVAIYCKVNVYQLFTMAFEFQKVELPEVTARIDYEQFITIGTVPKYVIDFCELVADSID